MNLPPPDGASYAILRNLNILDAPQTGAYFMGVIPGGIRVNVVEWRMEDVHTIYACIGGYPRQWIKAYHNGEKNINYVGGE